MDKIFDFKPKEFTKTEKAIEMLQEQLNGIQRQIAGICLKKGITAQEFAKYNHKEQEILEFLVEAQKQEDIIINGNSSPTKSG